MEKGEIAHYNISFLSHSGFKRLVLQMRKNQSLFGKELNRIWQYFDIFVAFVEDNATMSSIKYFENHALHFVQNQRK